MPITPEQAAALEAEDRHVRAQVQIYEWMERAEQHQAAADYVASLEEHSEDAQKTAAMHRADADRAIRFAHAWTEAANALAQPAKRARLGHVPAQRTD
ncbi:hypothetical protein [Streptomyces caniscabiei]|uniref:hypothetical protein n=1 Tax=Streptomyces caniscabiei TaxID=2746961 RepID=UPI0029BA0A56|nr:hypothetical protein [Streptomyces caniscabiei]MDX2948882.1 hypothetical protein [Streptomyces caniscabiei]